MGLLTKANTLDNEKGMAFSDFVKKYKLKFCAVFEKNDNYFLIKNSIGFDGVSILSSLSTQDYWNGICSNLNELNIFSDDNRTLFPLLQLFSFAQKDDIKTIAIYRFSPNKIFMLCNQDFPKECINDLLTVNDSKESINFISLNRLITRESKVLKMTIDFQEAVESFLQAQVKDKEKAALFMPSLCKEISNRFLCYFSKDVSSCISNNSVKTIFVVTKDLTQEHLVNHIILNLSSVIGKYSEIINFSLDGTANSIPEIKEYLQV